MRGDFPSQLGIAAEEMGQPRDIEENTGRLLGFFQPDNRTELVAGFGQCFQRRAVGRWFVSFDGKRVRGGWRLRDATRICMPGHYMAGHYMAGHYVAGQRFRFG